MAMRCVLVCANGLSSLEKRQRLLVVSFAVLRSVSCGSVGYSHLVPISAAPFLSELLF